MKEINSRFIEEFSRNKLYYGRINGEGGLSPKTVRDILSVVKSILDYAKENTSFEPITITYPQNEYREMCVLSRQEQQMLEIVLTKYINRSKLGILICLYTGI